MDGRSCNVRRRIFLPDGGDYVLAVRLEVISQRLQKREAVDIRSCAPFCFARPGLSALNRVAGLGFGLPLGMLGFRKLERRREGFGLRNNTAASRCTPTENVVRPPPCLVGVGAFPAA
jgi:hypothetical protein